MANWWDDFIGGIADILGPGAPPSNPVNSWVQSVAANIGSGIESGVVALLKDLWDVIIGPAEVVVGVILILIAIGIALRGDVIGVLPRPAI